MYGAFKKRKLDDILPSFKIGLIKEHLGANEWDEQLNSHTFPYASLPKVFRKDKF